jgi:hypothetical protein
MPEFKLPDEGFLRDNLGKIFDSLDKDGSFDKDLEKSLTDNGFTVIKDEQGKNIGFERNGKKIDKDALKTITEKTKGEFIDGKYTMDLEGVLKDLKFTPEEIKANEGAIKDLKGKLESSTGFREQTEQRERTENGQNATKKLGTPKTEDEFKNALKKLSEENRKKFEELQKDIDDKKDSTIGKWVKRGLLGAGIYTVYSLIKAHQNAMNGCWLYNTVDGSKCKISELTCNPDCRNTTTNGDLLCSSCQDLKKCSANQLNRCMIGGIVDTKKTNPVCTDDSKTTDCKSTDGNNMCASCLSNDSGSCASVCETENFNLASGYIVQCQDVDFWTAAGDAAQQPIKFATDFLQQILTIFKYTAIGIAILIAIYLVFQVILYLMHRNSSEEGKQEGNINRKEGKEVTIKYEKSSSSRRKR